MQSAAVHELSTASGAISVAPQPSSVPPPVLRAATLHSYVVPAMRDVTVYVLAQPGVVHCARTMYSRSVGAAHVGIWQYSQR
jgi:hypothetical protein